MNKVINNSSFKKIIDKNVKKWASQLNYVKLTQGGVMGESEPLLSDSFHQFGQWANWWSILLNHV